MYYYIVDANKLTAREFEKIQAPLYSSIAEYHISGEIVRVTGIRTIKQLVETAFFHQAKTIVAVGTDETLDEVVNVVGERQTTIGFIPLKPTPMAHVLGIPDVAQACKYLAVRRLEQIDLGVIENPVNGEGTKYFLSQLNIGLDLNKLSGFSLFGFKSANDITREQPFQMEFKIDLNYTAFAEIISAQIINSRGEASSKEIGNPADGQLDLLLLPKLNRNQAMINYKNLSAGLIEKLPNASVIHFNQIEILAPKDKSIEINGSEIAQIPLKIWVKAKSISLIVGKERKF